ncbi:hypothetical protein BC832DRAFT_55252 [Gaertneriomyces semiglobifer]|nr:hypothetical protein BC832DRAFT_55252 [Gaertneriomyces semiglobifer]
MPTVDVDPSRASLPENLTIADHVKPHPKLIPVSELVSLFKQKQNSQSSLLSPTTPISSSKSRSTLRLHKTQSASSLKSPSSASHKLKHKYTSFTILPTTTEDDAPKQQQQDITDTSSDEAAADTFIIPERRIPASLLVDVIPTVPHRLDIHKPPVPTGQRRISRGKRTMSAPSLV